MNNKILPKGFFNKERNIISMEESLNDIVPVDWDKALNNRKDTEEQVIKLSNEKLRKI